MVFVAIVMGAKVDFDHSKAIGDVLENKLGVRVEYRVSSAHQSPSRLLEVLQRYERDPTPKVIIAVAGLSNGLCGLTDAAVTCPVITCPVPSNEFAGSDVFSSLRTPPGVAPMVVLDPFNAAVAAAKILTLADATLSEKIAKLQQANRCQVNVDDCELKTRSYVARIESTFGKTFDETDLKLTPKNGATKVEKYVGKVRDRYSDGKNVVLVTTDRLTAFDRKLAQIPFKGQVLNLVSRWWFSKTQHIVKNHLVGVDVHPNVTVGRPCTPFPIEFVMRGYLTGSSGTAIWTNYKKGVRKYCGIDLPDGMVQHQKLECNIITPTTKSDEHDELIDPATIVKDGWMTQEDWDFCEAKAKEIFSLGQKLAAEHGLILVDTKYEFGKDNETGEILLIDEIHTPDSSRYWIASTYEENMALGKSPDNIDKEFIRVWFAANCDPYKDEVLPQAPPELLTELSRRYIMLFEMITGEDFPFANSDADINQSIQQVLEK